MGLSTNLSVMENLVEASSTIVSRKMSLQRYDSVSRTLAANPEGNARFIHLKVPHKIALATACGTDTLILFLSMIIFQWIFACLIPDIFNKSVASSPKV